MYEKWDEIIIIKNLWVNTKTHMEQAVAYHHHAF
jgi:hypothetical protein